MNKALVVFLVMLGGVAAARAAAPNEAAQPDPPDQVVVQAQREKLSALRVQLAMLEDKLFSDYNKLNQVPQYSIVCDTAVEAGTHFQEHECLPVFVHTAQQEAAQDFLFRISNGLRGHGAPPAAFVIAGILPDYQKNFRALVNGNPELRELVLDRAALVRHFEAVRKQKFKGKFIVWD